VSKNGVFYRKFSGRVLLEGRVCGLLATPQRSARMPLLVPGVPCTMSGCRLPPWQPEECIAMHSTGVMQAIASPPIAL